MMYHMKVFEKKFFCPTRVVAILKMAATKVRADFCDVHQSFSDLLTRVKQVSRVKNNFSTGPSTRAKTN